MRRVLYAALLTLTCSAYAIQAAGQNSISAEGVIESTSGGFKFPDGTVQSSAITSDLESRVGAPFGIADLSNAPIEGYSVCYDQVTGKLGNYAETASVTPPTEQTRI